MTRNRHQTRLLVVDDDPRMGTMMQILLTAKGYPSVKHVTSGAAALAAVTDADIVLLDHHLPDTTGMELLPSLLERVDPPAVIMVTGDAREDIAHEALQLGAEDCLTKDHALAGLLTDLVERVRRTRNLQHALVEAERELVRLAYPGLEVADASIFRGNALLFHPDPGVTRRLAVLLRASGFRVQRPESATELATHAAAMPNALVVTGTPAEVSVQHKGQTRSFGLPLGPAQVRAGIADLIREPGR